MTNQAENSNNPIQNARTQEHPQDIGNVVEHLHNLSINSPEKFAPEWVQELIGKYQAKWEGYRKQEGFSSQEQARITQDLKNMMDYWETQIVDKDDPQDDGQRNYGWARYTLENRQDSCTSGQPKLMEIGIGLTQQTWDDIVLGYAKRKLIKA